MTPEQAAAYVAAQTAGMLSELEGMKAANRVRAENGQSDAYGEEAFFELPTRWGVHHNQVMTVFNEANSR